MDIDHWWSYLEEKVVEAVVFKAAEMVPVMATSIAPWIAPCARGLVTYNTEYLKGSRPSVSTSTHPMECPKTRCKEDCRGFTALLHQQGYVYIMGC